MQVRDARPDDAMAIFALHVAASRRVPRDHYSDEQVRDWADKRGGGPERYDTDDLLVAERDGQVAGFGEWADSEDGDETVGEVVACYVHPDHANQGVGTALLERLHAELREAGYDRAALTASLNAVAFYERQGYEVVERFDLEPHDVEFPVARMEREL
jgi:GNAT superfamily N-acetyltransferase